MTHFLFQPLYPAKIWYADEVFYVQFIDLDNGFTFGETLAEAREMACDVLTALLSSALAHNEPIPFPSVAPATKDIHLIAPAAPVQATLLLHVAQLHKVVGKGPKQMKPLSRNPTVKQLQQVLKGLGKELVLELVLELR